MRLAFLSNVTLDIALTDVKKQHKTFIANGYGAWISYALSADDKLIAFNADFIFLILDGEALLENCQTEEEGLSELNKAISYIRQLQMNYSKNIVAVTTLDIKTRRFSNLENYWEQAIDSIDIIKFELKEIIRKYGSVNIYSDKMWYMGSSPYGIRSSKIFNDEINSFCMRYNQIPKKVLVLDLDNTIWGGVVGEDGANGIILGYSLLGSAYRDAQKKIKQIAEKGVLLTIASKNNPEDVDIVFSQNTNMFLQKEDFIIISANWEEKYINIRNIANELRLGLDSFVFVDDSEIERKKVKLFLPEVEVPDFPSDITKLPSYIDELYNRYFFKNKLTNEDRQKTESYRQEAKRKQDMEHAISFEDYLNSLEMIVEVDEINESSFERVIALSNKTNQFNTNTLRLNAAETREYCKNNHIYTARVSDKYGDAGLISIIMVRINDDKAEIDNFLMSCRVMGRKIEESIISDIESRLKSFGVTVMSASFVPSQKNEPVKDLWDRLGFSFYSEQNSIKHYRKQLQTTN